MRGERGGGMRGEARRGSILSLGGRAQDDLVGRERAEPHLQLVEGGEEEKEEGEIGGV